MRWCWLVHSSVSQSAKPTHTISRPRRPGEGASGIRGMIASAPAGSPAALVPSAPVSPPDLDAARSARLLFDAEIAAGTLTPGDVAVPRVLDAVRPHPVAPAPSRLRQHAPPELRARDPKGSP